MINIVDSITIKQISIVDAYFLKLSHVCVALTPSPILMRIRQTNYNW